MSLPSQAHAQQASFGSELRVGPSWLKQIHLPLALSALMLLTFGLIVIYSASLSIANASFTRQLIGVFLGVVLGAILYKIDYRNYANLTVFLLILDVLLLVAPLLPIIGVHSKGINGWIQIPLIGLRLQTSEIAKLVIIVLMASLASQYNGKIHSLAAYAKLCGFLSIPFFLILLQPDLGTGLVFLVSGAIVIMCAGPKKRWVIGTIGIMVALAAVVIISDPIIDGIAGKDVGLKDYQMARLNVFAGHDTEESYNLEQSLIAVGSGGVLGKGFGNATQSNAGYLPEAHTDFVFAFLSEEFGFAGGAVLLTLFLALMINGLVIAKRCNLLFGTLIAVGIVGMWLFQVWQSVGMCIGLMPITGIPLPFMSYGSSSMIVNIAAVGLLLSIWRHRTNPATPTQELTL